MLWPSLLESFRLPFTVNGNGEKRHKISRDTLNGQRLRWIFNVSYVQNHLLPYEFPLSSFARQRIPFNVLWVYKFSSISWVSDNKFQVNSSDVCVSGTARLASNLKILFLGSV